MAAHVKTALEQIIVDNFHYDHLLPAFDLSCWTEDLDFNDYCDLHDIVKAYATMPDSHRHDMVKQSAKLLLPKYIQQWESLGRPDTREAWRMAKFGK